MRLFFHAVAALGNLHFTRMILTNFIFLCGASCLGGSVPGEAVRSMTSNSKHVYAGLPLLPLLTASLRAEPQLQGNQRFRRSQKEGS